MADLLTKLAGQGAAVVAFDILFSEPDQTSLEVAVKRMAPDEAKLIEAAVAGRPGHDAEFAKAIASAPAVLAAALSNRGLTAKLPPKAGFAVAGDDPRPFIADFAGATSNLPDLNEAAQGIGSINWVPDRDQVIRRIPLIYREGEDYVPTLVTETLRVAQGAGTYILKASNSSGETAFGQSTGLNHIKVGDLEIPTDADGGIWLRFRPSNPAAYIPAWKVLAGENKPDEVAGRIILIGTSAPGLIDLRATPLDAAIPGVEIHAQAIEHIIAQRSLTRPDYALALELVIMLGARHRPQHRPAAHIGAGRRGPRRIGDRAPRRRRLGGVSLRRPPSRSVLRRRSPSSSWSPRRRSMSIAGSSCSAPRCAGHSATTSRPPWSTS